MDWSQLYTLANGFVLLPWAALILLPRGPKLHALVFYLGIGLLALAYSVLLIGLVINGGGIDVGAMGSLEGVMGLMASPAGVTVGWIHYLAFDLFVGLWIARDADAKGFSRLVQAPILLLTFVAGPFGLLLWLIIREKRARAGGRWE